MKKVFCIAAEFDHEDKLLKACEKTRDAGYASVEAYSPFPIHGLREAIGFKRPILSWVIFCGGLVGLCLGFGLCYWVSAINLPFNIGGRPLNSWPSFIPVTFEVTVLISALTATFGMFAFNGLPLPHHPIFNHPNFVRCSQDRFFLTIESTDPKFDPEGTRAFLVSLDPLDVSEVEDD